MLKTNHFDFLIPERTEGIIRAKVKLRPILFPQRHSWSHTECHTVYRTEDADQKDGELCLAPAVNHLIYSL